MKILALGPEKWGKVTFPKILTLFKGEFITESNKCHALPPPPPTPPPHFHPTKEAGPPGGYVCPESEFQNHSFSVLRRKPCRCRYYCCPHRAATYFSLESVWDLDLSGSSVVSLFFGSSQSSPRSTHVVKWNKWRSCQISSEFCER